MSIGGWRNVLFSLSANALARFSYLLALPLISRIYSKEAIGVHSLVLAASLVLAPLGTLRYEIAITTARHTSMAKALVICCLTLSFGIAVGIAGLLFSFPRLAAWLVDPQALQGLPLSVNVALVFLSANLVAISNAWLMRDGDVRGVALATAINGLVVVGAILLLPNFMAAHPQHLILGSILGNSTSTAYAVWRLCARHGRDLVTPVPAPLAWRSLSKFKNYPKFVLPYSLSVSVSERIVQVVLASTVSLGSLGVFYLVRLVFNSPALLIGQAMRTVVFSHLSRHRDEPSGPSLVAAWFSILAALGAPITGVMVVVGGDLVVRLLGPDYGTAAAYLPWIVVSSFVVALSDWFDRIFDVMGRQKLSVAMQASGDGVRILLLVALAALGAGESTIIAGFALAIVAYAILQVAVACSLLGLPLRWVAQEYAICAILLLAFFYGASSIRYSLGDRGILWWALLFLAMVPVGCRLAMSRRLRSAIGLSGGTQRGSV